MGYEGPAAEGGGHVQSAASSCSRAWRRGPGEGAMRRRGRDTEQMRPDQLRTASGERQAEPDCLECKAHEEPDADTLKREDLA